MLQLGHIIRSEMKRIAYDLGYQGKHGYGLGSYYYHFQVPYWLVCLSDSILLLNKSECCFRIYVFLDMPVRLYFTIYMKLLINITTFLLNIFYWNYE